MFKGTRIKRIYRMLINIASKELKLKSPQGLFALIWTIDNPLYLSDNPIQDAYVDKSALKKESTFVGQRKYLRLYYCYWYYYYSKSFFGKSRLSTTARRNTTATQLSAKTVRTISGKMLNMPVAWVKPRPTLSERLTMIILR